MEGIVWMTFSALSTATRAGWTRWHSMPRGMPAATAAAIDPKARVRCRTPSARKLSARPRYSFMIERLSHRPDASRPARRSAAPRRSATRRSGGIVIRDRLSVSSSAKARSSSQKPDAGDTRASLSPAGVR